ncbi:MAG: hypothetical protein PWQ55_802 [Chloroflexota bacterium]|nr:hypothetical protein [Chloroflexota bacterium]
MDNSQEFQPARQRGVIFHAGFLLLSISASGGFMMLALAQETRGFFILYLVGCIIAFLPVPLFAYRLFSLLRAKYVVDRDGLHIQWGLRTEDIPMMDIEWLRTADEMPYDIPMPRFSILGAIIGVQQSNDLGKLEFVASDSSKLILVAAHDKVLVISPSDMEGFLYAFRRYSEFGSIAPIQPRSTNVELMVTSMLKDKYARNFILAGLVLSVLLLILVSFVIPTRPTISMGFNTASGVMEEAPSERLLLLPLAALFMLAADVGLGSYLYRKEGYRIAAYIAFASSLVIPVSFLLLVTILLFQ